MNDEQILLAEYEHFSNSFWKNEELGEKRVTFFFTLTTAIIAGIVTLASTVNDNSKLTLDDIRLISSAALGCLFLFGFFTFLRILKRNRVTDEYKNILTYIRKRMIQRSAHLADYQLPFRSKPRRMLGGGLSESIGMINSLILAVLLLLWTDYERYWMIIVIVFISSFLLHIYLNKKTRYKESPPEKEIPPSFRASVGAVILNEKGKVLALKRSDAPDSWQFPQGGIESGENPEVAVLREIEEETGIASDHLVLKSKHPILLSYELPPNYQSHKTGLGQTQQWFYFQFTGSEAHITLGDQKEFSAYKWVEMEELLSTLVAFRLPVYQELARELSTLNVR